MPARGFLIGALVTAWVAAGNAVAQGVPATRLAGDALEAVPALALVEPLELFRRVGPDSTARILRMDLTDAGDAYLLDVAHREVRVVDSEGATVRRIKVPEALSMAVARDTILLTGMTFSRMGRRAFVLHVVDGSGATEPRSDTLALEFTGGSLSLWATDSSWVLGHPVVDLSMEVQETPLTDSLVLAELDPVSLRTRRKVALPLGLPRYAVAPDFFLHEVMALYPTYDVARDGRIYANVEGG